MEGNDQGVGFDTFRLVLFVILLVSLLSPGNHGQSSNLRETEEQKRMKKEKMSLENMLDADMAFAKHEGVKYAYNISGTYTGSWRWDENNVTLRANNVSLNVQQVLRRKALNRSIDVSEGTLSLQLYDRGPFKRNMHYVFGLLTLMKDKEEELGTISVSGVYFFSLGRLTLFANTYGTRFFLHWFSANSTSSPVTNEFSAIVGSSRNGSNILYLSSPIHYEDVATRCLYQFDADFLPLVPPADPDVRNNPGRHTMLNATGRLVGSNCQTSLEFQIGGLNIDTDYMVLKSRIYTTVFIAISFGECMLQLKMLQRMLATSAFPASLLSFLAIAAIDLLTALAHSLAGLLFLGAFSELYFISFHKFFVFSVVEMRLIFVVWRGRHDDLNADNIPRHQRRLSCMFLLLYVVIITTLIAVYNATTLGYALLFLLFSFWLPQILRSLQLGQRPPFEPLAIVLLTLTILALPLYLVACPHNLLASFAEVSLPRGYGVALILWVAVQVAAEMAIHS